MCRKKTKFHTFKETNLPELQTVTVKSYFSGQAMFIAALYKAPNLRDAKFQNELMTDLIETGHHSTQTR